MLNKKGGMKVYILFFIMLTGIAFLLYLGTWIFVSDQINTALSEVGQVGQVNMTTATADTWGKFDSALANSANLMALSLVFGLFIGLIVVAYFSRGKTPTLFWILDLLILIVVYIFATFLSNAYATIISLDTWSSNYAASLGNASLMMLNLPIIVAVVGIITMIISYAGIPRKSEDERFIGN